VFSLMRDAADCCRESALRHAIILFPNMNGSYHNGFYVK